MNTHKLDCFRQRIEPKRRKNGDAVIYRHAPADATSGDATRWRLSDATLVKELNFSQRLSACQ